MYFGNDPNIDIMYVNKLLNKKRVKQIIELIKTFGYDVTVSYNKFERGREYEFVCKHKNIPSLNFEAYGFDISEVADSIQCWAENSLENLNPISESNAEYIYEIGKKIFELKGE